MASVAAVVFAVVTAGAVVFQFALALGAPWGEYAMGGRSPGRFPPGLRIAAVAQAGVLALLAVIVLSAAGLAARDLVDGLTWLPWLTVAFSAVSLLVNAISPSPKERRVWVPVAVVLLVSSLLVALTAG